MSTTVVELVDRIKQMKANRKSIFGVEGDGVDVLLDDCWAELESLSTELRSWQDAAQHSGDGA
jgi:hypothetical protein